MAWNVLRQERGRAWQTTTSEARVRRLLLMLLLVSCWGSYSSNPSSGGGTTSTLLVQPMSGQPASIGAPGGTLQLAAFETMSDGYGNDTRQQVTATWSSASPSVATVDQNGNVTAVASGTAVITASTGSARGEITVTVGAPGMAE